MRRKPFRLAVPALLAALAAGCGDTTSCQVECIAPPDGCHYEHLAACSCGSLVCSDAGAADASVDASVDVPREAAADVADVPVIDVAAVVDAADVPGVTDAASATDGSDLVDCDPSHAFCDRLPTVCTGGGEVASVFGGCWGPCVLYTRCMPIACNPDATGSCPTNLVCFRTTRTCGPPV